MAEVEVHAQRADGAAAARTIATAAAAAGRSGANSELCGGPRRLLNLGRWVDEKLEIRAARVAKRTKGTQQQTLGTLRSEH